MKRSEEFWMDDVGDVAMFPDVSVSVLDVAMLFELKLDNLQKSPKLVSHVLTTGVTSWCPLQPARSFLEESSRLMTTFRTLSRMLRNSFYPPCPDLACYSPCVDQLVTPTPIRTIHHASSRTATTLASISE